MEEINSGRKEEWVRSENQEKKVRKQRMRNSRKTEERIDREIMIKEERESLEKWKKKKKILERKKEKRNFGKDKELWE